MLLPSWLHRPRNAAPQTPTRLQPLHRPVARRLKFEPLEDRALLASGLSAALVADIVPGTTSSYPSQLTNVDGTLIFDAWNPSTASHEIWTSDGTADGTLLIKGDFLGAPRQFAAAGESIIFSHWQGLWKTDGTAEGTVLIRSVSAYELSTVGDRIFFQGGNGKGVELWVSDGTARGTKLVKDIYTGSSNVDDGSCHKRCRNEAHSSFPAWLTNLNGTLFFAASDGEHGRELWRSDGTGKGTTLVKDIAPGWLGSNPQYLTVFHGVLYFGADDGLWVSDGTEGGTLRVKEFSVSPAYLTEVNGVLFFAVGSQLWKSNGTTVGTMQVSSATFAPQDLTDAGGKLFFTADDGASGRELWRSDGTAAGTVRVKDIHPGAESSNPSHLTDVNGRLYFVAEDGVHGPELWQSDGTAASTIMEDIYPGSEGSYPDYLVAMNNKLYFAATDLVHGRELWDPPPVESTVDSLLVVDYGRDAVHRYDGQSGAFVDDIVPHRSGGLDQPSAAIFGPDGNADGHQDLYVSAGLFTGEGQTKGVFRYDGVTGAFIDVFSENGVLESPRGVVFGPDGDLYVADMLLTDPRQGRVARFDGATGKYLGDFVSPVSGGLRIPHGLVFGPSGHNPNQLDLYISSTSTDSILQYDGATGEFRGDFVVAGSGGLDAPYGLTFGPDGNLYVASRRENPVVLRFQGPSGKAPGAVIDTFVPAASGGLMTPFAVLFGPDGNGDGQQDLYITNSETAPGGQFRKGTVKRYDGVSGEFIDTFVTRNSGRLDDPSLMTFNRTDPTTLAYIGVPRARPEVTTSELIVHSLNANRMQRPQINAPSGSRMNRKVDSSQDTIDVQVAELPCRTSTTTIGIRIRSQEGEARWSVRADKALQDDYDFLLTDGPAALGIDP